MQVGFGERQGHGIDDEFVQCLKDGLGKVLGAGFLVFSQQRQMH